MIGADTNYAFTPARKIKNFSNGCSDGFAILFGVINGTSFRDLSYTKSLTIRLFTPYLQKWHFRSATF